VAYVECTECGFRANASRGFVGEASPRCRARTGKCVWLREVSGIVGSGRRFERVRKLRDAELREAGLPPAED
jgi:hypothetical protein